MTILVVVFSLNSIQAQNIIDDLQSITNASEGVIRIESDPAITALIGTPNNHIDPNKNYDYAERSGYRIQVFMGNSPGKARSEATSKQATIKESFPDLATYLIYESPNWKLLAGDFITREEANLVKQQLQREFPQFGKEMYVIVDKIKLPIERAE
ncbi:hypothetical protein FACS189474_2500 [Bacteroidia bacterium]|nr:hypothetical protein FACS189474_2500 [Bacteroidia bacterium]